MSGKAYYSPQKDGRVIQRFVASRSTRKDGRPKRISRRAACIGLPRRTEEELRKLQTEAKTVREAVQQMRLEEKQMAGRKGREEPTANRQIEEVLGASFGDDYDCDFGGFDLGGIHHTAETVSHYRGMGNGCGL